MLRIRSVRAGVALVCLAALLPSCGGDGNFQERVNFGINGAGQCDNMVVDVDIAGAFAVLAHTSDGSIDCRPSELLDSSCDVSFVEIDSGRTLRVTIDDCLIAPTTGLFGCGFSKVDVGLLQTQMDAECSCATNRCDDTPPMCASRDDNPYFCENCSDGKDNDDDRLVDCSDPNCDHSYECAGSTSSTTTSSTNDNGTTMPPTSSTTTTTSTTSSTMPETPGFTLFFGVADGANIGSVKWDTDYSDISLLNQRSLLLTPDCISLVTGATSSFSNDPETQVLHASMSGLSGASGPLTLAACTFESPVIPTKDDFSVTVVEARDTANNIIASPPPVSIDDIDFHGVTTTTEQNDTTTTTVTTTTVVLGETAIVVFRVDSATGAIGALQLGINYTNAPGEFVGSGSSVDCTSKINGALFAPNDLDASRDLKLGIVALTGFSAPADAVECTFSSTPGDSPVASDFTVTVEDATDGDGAPITAAVSVRLKPAP